MVGNHHDYKVQDSSSIGSPSPHIIDHEPNQTKNPTGESLSPPPGFESSREEEGSSLSSESDDGRKSVNSKKSGTSLMIEGSVATKIFEDLGGTLCNVINIGCKLVSIIHYTRPGTCINHPLH